VDGRIYMRLLVPNIYENAAPVKAALTETEGLLP